MKNKDKTCEIEDKEERIYEIEDLEVRVEGDDDNKKPVIRGHAAVFDKLSVNLGGFREKISPGAFAKSLNRDVKALFNHNSDLILGRTKAKTLRLAEDEKGLAIEIDPPNNTIGNDTVESIRRRDISQMSFAFRTIKDKWEHEEGKDSIRTLEEVELFDVSPVTYPAYPQTDVAVRSLELSRRQNGSVKEDYLTAIRKKRLDLAAKAGVSLQ